MGYVDSDKVNQMVKKLVNDQKSDHLLKNYDISGMLNKVLSGITTETREYIKSHRIDMYKTHHPFFFKPIVNHMLVKVVQTSPVNSFEQFDLNLGVAFELNKLDGRGKMESINKYTHHPFTISDIVDLIGFIRINLQCTEIVFNHDNIDLWVSPDLSEKEFLYAKNILTNSEKITLYYEKKGVEESIDLTVDSSNIYSLAVITQLMLEAVSPQMFGQISLSIDKNLELIINQKVKLKYIDITYEQPVAMQVSNIFNINILPLFSIFEDYSKKLKITGSTEFEQIYPSNTYSHTSLLHEDKVLFNNVAIQRYGINDEDEFNYIIKEDRHKQHSIKINGNAASILKKNVQVHGTWTQLVDVDAYSEKLIKILDRSKSTYYLRSVYKANYVLNENHTQVNRFIELSHFINNKKLTKSVLISLYKIITPRNFERIHEADVLEVEFNALNNELNLTMFVKNDAHKQQLFLEVARVEKLLNYLYSSEIEVILKFEL